MIDVLIGPTQEIIEVTNRINELGTKIYKYAVRFDERHNLTADSLPEDAPEEIKNDLQEFLALVKRLNEYNEKGY